MGATDTESTALVRRDPMTVASTVAAPTALPKTETKREGRPESDDYSMAWQYGDGQTGPHEVGYAFEADGCKRYMTLAGTGPISDAWRSALPPRLLSQLDATPLTMKPFPMKFARSTFQPSDLLGFGRLMNRSALTSHHSMFPDTFGHSILSGMPRPSLFSDWMSDPWSDMPLPMPMPRFFRPPRRVPTRKFYQAPMKKMYTEEEVKSMLESVVQSILQSMALTSQDESTKPDPLTWDTLVKDMVSRWQGRRPPTTQTSRLADSTHPTLPPLDQRVEELLDTDEVNALGSTVPGVFPNENKSAEPKHPRLTEIGKPKAFTPLHVNSAPMDSFIQPSVVSTGA